MTTKLILQINEILRTFHKIVLMMVILVMQAHVIVTAQQQPIPQQPSPPLIITDPKNVTVTVGDSAIFEITVKTDSILIYRWQLLDKIYWTDIDFFLPSYYYYSGEFTNKLTINPVPAVFNGNQYRMATRYRYDDIYTYTNYATLTVNSRDPLLSFLPDQTTSEGVGVSFSITAGFSDGKMTCQWQVLTPFGWSDIYDEGIYSGVETLTLSLSNGVDYSYNGNTYRCVVTFEETPANPFFTQSNEAILTVLTNGVAPTITTTFLPQTQQGESYSTTLAASGTAPISWSITSGSLPAGLILNQNTGMISGMPTTAGSFSFVVEARNIYGSDRASYTIIISSPAMPAILTHPADQSIMQHTDASFAVTTRDPDIYDYQYQWQYRPNANSDFTDISDSDVYSNTRAAMLTLLNVPITYNDYQYRCYVYSRQWNWAEMSEIATLTVTTVGVAPTITTASLPQIQLGRSYNAPLAARGTAPITWSIESGRLPAGLSLNRNTGIISGMPTTTGQINFTVRATNSFGNDTKSFTLVVSETLPNVIEVLPPPDSEPFCTESNVASVPFRNLDTDEHTIQYSLRFSADAKAAGFKDTPFANLPADMAFKIDVPQGAPSRSYSAVVIIQSNATTAYQDEYPFTFSIMTNGVVIVNQPPAFQSLCGTASIALTVDIGGNAKGYQWFKNNQAISGARNKEYEVTTEGSYHVEIMGECGVIRSNVSVVSSPSSSPSGVSARVKWGNVLYVENATEHYVRYQWYHNGTAMLGETFVYITVKEGFLGTYYVRCYKTDESYVETCPIVFDVRTRGVSAHVYPTVLKANDALNIDITDAGLDVEATVEIYSLIGVQVYSTKINTPIATIRPDIQIKGNYFVKIKLSSGEVINEKIVVQ